MGFVISRSIDNPSGFDWSNFEITILMTIYGSGSWFIALLSNQRKEDRLFVFI